MKKNGIFAFLVLFLLLANCVRISQDEAIGLYVSRNNVNTIDTLRVLKDGSYIQVIYRKGDKSLIYKNVGNWKASLGYIKFDDFFAEEDEIHSTEFTNYEKVLMTTKLSLEKLNRKIIIHHKSMHDNIYLEKIK